MGLYFHTINKPEFTVISYNTKKVVQRSEGDINTLIKKLHREDPQHSPNYLNNLIKISGNYFYNTPYNVVDVQGESDWCGASMHAHGCAHIQQNPIYRTDRFDCNTFVQTVLALVNADNITEYNHHIIHINYGIAHLIAHQPFKITYANRNNFMSADFNAVNQSTRRLKDVTQSGIFRDIAKITSAYVTRAKWFAHQTSPQLIRYNVIVLNKKEGPAMMQRFKNHYGSFFQSEKVSIPYIPKSALVNKNHQANINLINQIPTPSVIEIVRDDHKWFVYGKKINHLIKSGINVSHVGFLYHHTFQNHEIIFQKTTCGFNWLHHEMCRVTPIICHDQRGCYETMMLTATDQFPHGFRWSYNKNKNQYYCTSKQNVPNGAHVLGTCNRVYKEPLSSYLTAYLYGVYAIMDDDSVLGINIQKILKPHNASCVMRHA